MVRSEFTIFRKNYVNKQTGKPDFQLCARFHDENNQIIKTKTLEAKKPKEATIEAQKMLKKGGLGISGEDPLVLDILTDFWRKDSRYALTKKRRGKALSESYIYISSLVVKKHLTKPLEGIRVSKLTVPFMERMVERFEKEGKSPKTINAALHALTVPLRNWARKHQIPYPLQYFDGHCAEKPKERGILSVEEVMKIIDLQDESPRVKLAVLLGCMRGLRLGEVVGLQQDDVDTDKKVIHVRHNWVTNTEG